MSKDERNAQVPVGVYPEGVVKYRCASKGYTAWWQRKLYFTFLTTYILVVPAVFMTFCYVNVVLVVWRRSRELSARTTSNTPTIQIHDEQTGNVQVGETGSRHHTAVSLSFRSQSDAGSHRFRRFRRATGGSERETSLQLHSHNDELSTGTGNASNRSSPTSPRLRRAAFNVAAMSRARVRTVQMTLCIVLSFIACWTPYFTVHLVHIWSEYERKIPEVVYVFAETLALVNSAVNPLLYACFNSSMYFWRCRRRPADRPLECVDLQNRRSQAGAFGSVSDCGRTWPRTAANSSTCFGHSIGGERSANVGESFRGATRSNGRDAPSAPVGRSCNKPQ